MDWVLDTSVTMAWCFEDERTDKTDALLDLLSQGDKAIVPQIWPLEVANVLVLATRKKRITPAQRRQFLELMEGSPIRVDITSSGTVFNEVLNLAETHQITSYDASYLELAMRRGLGLATLDKNLKKAAATVGVTCLT